MLITALGGGNLIHDVGYVEAGMTASYDMIVAMNELAGLVKRFMGGIDINQETLALEVIDQVGPGGHYVGEQHTYQNFRRNWVPELLDRDSYEDWEKDGQLTLGARTADKVRQIFETYESTALEEDVNQALGKVIQRAEERVG